MSKFKNVIIFVVILALAFVGYSIFVNKGNTSSSSSLTSAMTGAVVNPVSTDQTGTGSTTGQEFLNTLLGIQNIKLNASVFDSASFLSLQDYTTTLIPEPSGRPNPFAPIDSFVQAPVVNSSTSIVTTLPVTSSLKFNAVLNGSTTSTDVNATRWFEYGTTTDMGSKTPEVSVGGVAGSFHQTAAGLTRLTTYYFKAAIKVGDVVTYGEVLTFKTN